MLCTCLKCLLVHLHRTCVFLLPTLLALPYLTLAVPLFVASSDTLLMLCNSFMLYRRRFIYAIVCAVSLEMIRSVLVLMCCIIECMLTLAWYCTAVEWRNEEKCCMLCMYHSSALRCKPNKMISVNGGRTLFCAIWSLRAVRTWVCVYVFATLKCPTC